RSNDCTRSAKAFALHRVFALRAACALRTTSLRPPYQFSRSVPAVRATHQPRPQHQPHPINCPLAYPTYPTLPTHLPYPTHPTYLTHLPYPTRPSYPSVSSLIWYCSSFLYKLLRGVPITSAVFEMFQPFSRGFPARNMRSAFSLNSRSVPSFAPSPSPAAAVLLPPPEGDRTLSGRSGRSIVSAPVMMISRSTVLRSSRMLPFHR